MNANEIKLLEEYVLQIDCGDAASKQLNKEYFTALYQKYTENSSSSSSSLELKLHCPEEGIESPVVPFAIAGREDLLDVSIGHYKDITVKHELIKNLSLKIMKMHAGLGSSVERFEHLSEVVGRTTLGSKGTDLYLKIQGEYRSLAELQYIQMQLIQKQNAIGKISIQSLVNEDTWAIVKDCSEKTSYIDQKKFKDTITEASQIFQLKMPTIHENGELTLDRVAPGGHAFLGFYLLSEIFNEEESADEIITIGNGEDLNSVADEKILTWMVEEQVPIAMITTTKLEKDKKGGQISLVKEGDQKYVTIIEKAQAEKADQLAYFEELGLRDSDNLCLFNTNIVVINRSLVKSLFKKYLSDMSFGDFSEVIAPDLIRNVKEQDGKKYTQLEGAIGSLLLNLDKYMRVNFGESCVKFLNLDSVARENFFIPIKKMDDFIQTGQKYIFNETTGRLDLKGSHE